MNKLNEFAKMFEELLGDQVLNHNRKLLIGKLLFQGRESIRNILTTISYFTTSHQNESLMKCFHTVYNALSTELSTCYRTQYYLLGMMQNQNQIFRIIAKFEHQTTDEALKNEMAETKNFLRLITFHSY